MWSIMTLGFSLGLKNLKLVFQLITTSHSYYFCYYFVQMICQYGVSVGIWIVEVCMWWKYPNTGIFISHSFKPQIIPIPNQECNLQYRSEISEPSNALATRWPRVDKDESISWFVFANVLANALARAFVIHFAPWACFLLFCFSKATQ